MNAQHAPSQLVPLDDELRYLGAEIYRHPDADPPIKRLTAFDRFRA